MKINIKLEKKALKFCMDKKHRYTEPRRFVLQIIAASKKPIKAYEILEKLNKIIDNPKPPTAYRAIDFWSSHNFIHRIESLNAYTLCKVGHFHSGSQFMICNECGDVIESHLCDLPQVIKNSVKQKTFTLTKWNLEINGVCNKCT